jgi:hypothetical protein
MNKRGQITGIIAFVLIVITLIMLAPFLIKIVMTPSQKFVTAIANVDTNNVTVAATSKITGTFTGAIDWIIVAMFFINVIILLVTSFLVDIHPAFFVIYLIAIFFLVLFAPTFITFADTLYDNPSFTTLPNGEDLTSYLPITNWIFDNFGLVIMTVIILSGLIMFGKFKFGSSQGSTNF